MEIWKDVLGYEGLYQVSSIGRVKRLKGTSSRTLKGDRLLKPGVNKDGYEFIYLSKNSKTHNRTIHTIVCEAFFGPRPATKQAAHQDGNKLNNSAENLQWSTRLENEAGKIRHGTKAAGESHGKAKLTDGQVAEIRRRYNLGGEGNKPGQLSKEYGISLNYVSMLAKNKRRFAPNADCKSRVTDLD